MTEQLPISINTSKELSSLVGNNIISVVNRLEAQLNFQTMLANWYGDEETAVSIQLQLHEPIGFSSIKECVTQQADAIEFSDDVLFVANSMLNDPLLCYIAITEAELILLSQQPKLCSAFLQAKLTKVLSLIAKQQSYPPLAV